MCHRKDDANDDGEPIAIDSGKDDEEKAHGENYGEPDDVSQCILLKLCGGIHQIEYAERYR